MEEIKTNIESIQKKIESETFITETKIYDGISLECKVPENKTYEKCEKEIRKKSKEWNYLPVNIEPRKEAETVNYFLVQYPEMIPYYTEEQKHFMFYDSLNFLVNNNIELSKKAGYKVTRKMLMDTVERYIQEVIKIYYNSNVNKYKVTLQDLLCDIRLRNELKEIFLDVITKYV